MKKLGIPSGEGSPTTHNRFGKKKRKENYEKMVSHF